MASALGLCLSGDLVSEPHSGRGRVKEEHVFPKPASQMPTAGAALPAHLTVMSLFPRPCVLINSSPPSMCIHQ